MIKYSLRDRLALLLVRLADFVCGTQSVRRACFLHTAYSLPVGSELRGQIVSAMPPSQGNDRYLHP